MLLKFNLHKAMGMQSIITEGSLAIAAWGIIAEEEIKDVKKLLAEPKTYPLRKNEAAEGAFNFSNMNFEKEVKLDSIRAHSVLMVSNLASAKTGNILKQYFLIDKVFEDGSPKEKEDMINEIKVKFFKTNMKALPIPIKEAWEEYFWDEIKKSLTRLSEKGTPPMAGFVMSLPDLNFLARLIEKCHAKSEFKQYKGRLPNVDALLAIADIRGFDIQTWVKDFIPNVLGELEKLGTYSEEHQETIVRGFELFGATKLILTNLNQLHSSSLRPLTINIRLMDEKDEGKKKQYRSALRKILEEFTNKHSDLISIINNFDDLFKEHHHNIKSGNWKAIERYLATIVYDDVSEGCRELALTCGRASVSKADYPKYEEAYLDNIQNCLTAAKHYPTISGAVKDSKVTWEMIDMSDPRAWVVGIETNCCQHLGSVGGDCVRYAAANPSTSGIFRVDEKGKTIAQSFFWLQESSKKDEYILVLDNIEVAGYGGEKKELDRSTVLDAYRSFAESLEKYSPLFRIRAITIGTGYMEGFLSKLSPDTAKNENHARVPNTLGYSDAHTQKLFKEFKVKPVMAMPTKPTKGAKS